MILGKNDNFLLSNDNAIFIEHFIIEWYLIDRKRTYYNIKNDSDYPI
jgi:hypothetical protein